MEQKKSSIKKIINIIIFNVIIILSLYTIITTYLTISRIEDSIDSRLEKSEQVFKNYFDLFIDNLVYASTFISNDKKILSLINTKNEIEIYDQISYLNLRVLNNLGELFLEVIDSRNKIFSHAVIPQDYKTKNAEEILKVHNKFKGTSLYSFEKNDSINIKIINTALYAERSIPLGHFIIGFTIDKNSWFASTIKDVLHAEIFIFNNNKIISSTIFNPNTLERNLKFNYDKKIIDEVIKTQKCKQSILKINNKNYSVKFIPLLSKRSKLNGVIGIALSREDIEKNKIEAIIFFLIFGIVVILITIFSSLFFSKKIMKPILKLSSLTSKITSGDYNVSMNYKYNDEIGNLISSFNNMTQTINEYKENLEEKVIVRTKELNTAVKDLNLANKKLKDLDSLKNDFIANITHDFRSPLTIILNLADLKLKQKEKLKNKSVEAFEIIYKASFKLLETIDRLLEIAKMDARGINLNITKLDIKKFLESIVDYHKSLLSNTGIKITLDLPDDPIDKFFTDKEKVEEIINNVFSNAVKFVDKKKGLIKVGVDINEKFLNISISDNGIGIDPSELDSIFDRFEQGSHGKDSKYKGTGIGLSFCKQLIDYLSGSLKAYSKGLNSGSTFTISLPLGKKHFKKEEFKGEETKTRRYKHKAILYDMESKNESKEIFTFINDVNKQDEFNQFKSIILIVEDDTRIQNIILEYLQNAGYKNFICAKNGKMGLDAFYKYLPDLVISDLNMPEMDGDEMHDLILANPNFSFVPFIFLSAINNREYILERKEKGASDFLQKPIIGNELISSLNTNLKRYMEFLKIVTIDELTQFQNRRTILKSLEKALAKRIYSDLSVIFFDLDHFKKFNDTYGHNIGDQVLKKVGEIVIKSIRANDIAGRYGGEEFLIILPETNIQNAKIVAKKLKTAILNSTIEYDDLKLKISASFGISSLIDNEDYICKLLEINSLRPLFEITNFSKENLKKIDNYKKEITSILINMADSALYYSKNTICKKCNFKSLKENDFKNNKCPKCNSKNIKPGRNDISLFKK